VNGVVVSTDVVVRIREKRRDHFPIAALAIRDSHRRVMIAPIIATEPTAAHATNGERTTDPTAGQAAFTSTTETASARRKVAADPTAFAARIHGHLREFKLQLPLLWLRIASWAASYSSPRI
jgi:hypothetical protein